MKRDKYYVTKTSLLGQIDESIVLLNNPPAEFVKDQAVKIACLVKDLIGFRKVVEEMSARDYIKNNRDLVDKARKLTHDAPIACLSMSSSEISFSKGGNLLTHS